MIKAFTDANILVSVLNKEYPSFTHTSRILSLKEKARVRVFTSPICIAIAYYLAEKKQRGTAKQKLQALCKHMEIAESSRTSVQSAFSNLSSEDFYERYMLRKSA